MKNNISNEKLYKFMVLIVAFIVSLSVPLFLSQHLPVSADGSEIVRFHPYRQWTPDFSDLNGWNLAPSNWGTIQFADINGDGMDDVCGLGNLEIYCAHSDGNNLGNFDEWVDSFSNWHTDPSYWATIRFPDLNGDGMADVCGRDEQGMMCGLSDGSTFAALTNWHPGFGNAFNWQADEAYWGTIRFPDLNGDGMADICARGVGGLSCGLSDGQSFGNLSTWAGSFADANGWNDRTNWGTIQYADINGDGMVDVCGRANGGIHCAKSTGVNFIIETYWTVNYRDTTGWDNDEAYWGTIRFPDLNGDGMADVCGRATGGLYCGLSTGNSFSPSAYWDDFFSDANGWHSDPSFYGTIKFQDLDGDGMDDVCGRAASGLYCAKSQGTVFGDESNWQAGFGDQEGWGSDPSYWQTMDYADVNGDGFPDICGRHSTGIVCATGNTADSQPPPNLTFKSYIPTMLN